MKQLLNKYNNFKNADIWHNPVVVQGGGLVLVVAVIVALLAVFKHSKSGKESAKNRNKE
jgi:hypothetical protein